MKVGIFYNATTNPKNKEHAVKVANILDSHKTAYILNPKDKDFPKIDLAIAVGGDGTVLYTANILAGTKLPILGVNFGHRGFLCELDRDEAEKGIRLLLEGKYTIVEKTRIQATIRKRNKEELSLEALNEISIGGINRTVNLETDISTPDRTFKTQISGDGLIISTQTGSTAYNINAGGPMLLEEAFCIVANNAFFASDSLLPITKSLVVPVETTVTIKDLSHNPDNLPFVIADGQESIKTSKEDLILVKKAMNKNYFIKF